MNFYKYQNKLMSICEKMPFKCTECYQTFLAQADLQCHLYEHHRVQRELSTPSRDTKDCVKQEPKNVCGVDGDDQKHNDDNPTEKLIKAEDQNEVNVKTENGEKDDEDEELIDVGVNNRNCEKLCDERVDDTCE